MELVIVTAIIAIIAAIAIRRVSSHAEQAGTNAGRASLAVLQQAIDRYTAEHGKYPSASGVSDQLTRYSDAFGVTAAAPGHPFVYGPYVRAIPPAPTGPAIGKTKIAAVPAADVAWLYDASSGQIALNE
jgi:type II secretory pathway pseudopilin PulG